MAKKLLIVESPAKIKTISKFLGKDFKIMSTVGHIKDLPAKKIGVTIDKDTINIEYVVMPDKDKTIADICKEASTAADIYLAPDPDREGEIIAWHIAEDIKKVVKDKSKIHRISFNEITEPAIKAAIENPGEIDMPKVNAQQARRVLDRWVGYEVSPVLWKKIAKGLSAGRVQSVALRLIADREEEIRGFKPEEYWTIDGDFAHGKAHLIAALTHINKKKAEIKSEKEAQAIVEKLKKSDFVIESIIDKTRIKNPLPPFMTSTLQQAGFNQLGFSVKKIMQVAQKLYEGMPLGDASSPVALITYMRTDSLRISDTALTQTREYLKKHYSKEYVPTKANNFEKSKKGKAQDAHEAIRPIDVNLTPDKVKAYLPKDALKLYELIWKRFVACQMTPAQYAQRQVTIEGGTFTFRVTGSTLIFDGYLKVYSASDDQEEKEGKVTIPATLKAKEAIDLEKIDPKQHFTQPPPKYTEGSLVKEMEKEGIGRPSTYATILSTIQARSYTTLDDKKRFVPTELGMIVTRMLVENLPDIMDIKFTAHLEEDLDKVASGDLERDKLLREFYTGFQKDLTKFKGKDSKRTVEKTEVICPNCKKEQLIVRFGKTGEFLGCPNYPECTFTCNFHRTEENKLECVEAEEPKVLDEKCPTCGSPLRQVVGRYGPFIACSNYPTCKYIHKIKAGFPCPADGGEVVQRKWRGGSFWGCSNYPKCKFAVFGDIVETPCPDCKLPFLVKKVAKDGTITLLCHDKKCGYKKVEKA
ncbi:MAG: type I DNA topoisomerase [Candidatus Dependentiae bacterium]|nr:type I DNA topoisomerase [Candidatus Dependentiae bacterium]